MFVFFNILCDVFPLVFVQSYIFSKNQENHTVGLVQNRLKKIVRFWKVFFQKNRKVLNPFKSSWKVLDNHDFFKKQRVILGLNQLFSKNCFCNLPLKSSRKDHFFFKKINFCIFSWKKCFIERNDGKKWKKWSPGGQNVVSGGLEYYAYICLASLFSFHMVDRQRGPAFKLQPPLLILALAPEPESTKKLSGTRRITFP